MKLLTFKHEKKTRIGVLDNGCVVDVTAVDPDVPGDMNALIELGDEGIAMVSGALRRASGDNRIDVDEVKILAPIPKPHRNIFCVGKNYHAHAEEFHGSGFDAADKTAIPDVPIFFTKATTSVIGPSEPIPASSDPAASTDYEVELVIVIGSGGRNIDPQDVAKHIFGYTIINDVTSRGLQRRHKQWFLGKSFDGFCPMGPCIVTTDEVGELDRIEVRTLVNGELRQKALVRDMIFDVPTIISTLSSVVSLQPGDLIATGTPDGVGIGFEPPRYLIPGDQVVLTIEPIGELCNPVV